MTLLNVIKYVIIILKLVKYLGFFLKKGKTVHLKRKKHANQFVTRKIFSLTAIEVFLFCLYVLFCINCLYVSTLS
jgi:hypothetical protein